MKDENNVIEMKNELITGWFIISYDENGQKNHHIDFY